MASSGKKRERNCLGNCTLVDAALSLLSTAEFLMHKRQTEGPAVHKPGISMWQFCSDQ